MNHTGFKSTFLGVDSLMAEVIYISLNRGSWNNYIFIYIYIYLLLRHIILEVEDYLAIFQLVIKIDFCVFTLYAMTLLTSTIILLAFFVKMLYVSNHAIDKCSFIISSPISMPFIYFILPYYIH